MVRRVTVSRPVAGPVGNFLPRLLVALVHILLDREVLAARRAAYRHRTSADPEKRLAAAYCALHQKPLTLELTTDEHG